MANTVVVRLIFLIKFKVFFKKSRSLRQLLTIKKLLTFKDFNILSYNKRHYFSISTFALSVKNVLNLVSVSEILLPLKSYFKIIEINHYAF